MPTIETNNISINYQIDTQADTSRKSDLIVLINGLADDLQTWSSQIPSFLSANYTVLRYDNRGIGQSGRPPGPYTAELLADDLHALLQGLEPQLPTKRFHLLGVSMGGMIAQTYALKYPNRSPTAQGWELLTLSLCCTYAQPTTFCSRMFTLWADMAQRMSVNDVMREVLLRAFTVPFFQHRTDELVEFEKAMAELDMPTEAYLAQLNVIQQFDSTPALEGLKAEGKGLGGLEGRRVLVLAGKVDILIPVVLSRELAERIEGSQFLTTKGGHACLWEFPGEFNRTVLGFLEEHRYAKS